MLMLTNYKKTKRNKYKKNKTLKRNIQSRSPPVVIPKIVAEPIPDIKYVSWKDTCLLEDGEKDIPYNNYEWNNLPIPDKYNVNGMSVKHYFNITQDETPDGFIGSVRQTQLGYEVFIGGEELKGCIIISINRVEYDNPDSRIEAFLNVTYNERCNITNDLSKGKGTITLMRTAISFVFTYFKIDKFILKDASEFKCGRIHISLPALYILKYGVSWYQKHINAHIYNEELLAGVARYKRFIETKPEWKFIYDKYILHDLRRYRTKMNMKEDNKYKTLKKIMNIKSVLYNAWLNTNNYREFILDIISIDNQCSYLMEWFNNIFTGIMKPCLYGLVDNFIFQGDFPFIQGLNVTHRRTDILGEEEYENDMRIKTLRENEEYTINGGGKACRGKLLFSKIIFRHSGIKSKKR